MRQFRGQYGALGQQRDRHTVLRHGVTEDLGLLVKYIVCPAEDSVLAISARDVTGASCPGAGGRTGQIRNRLLRIRQKNARCSLSAVDGDFGLRSLPYPDDKGEWRAGDICESASGPESDLLRCAVLIEYRVRRWVVK